MRSVVAFKFLTNGTAPSFQSQLSSSQSDLLTKFQQPFLSTDPVIGRVSNRFSGICYNFLKKALKLLQRPPKSIELTCKKSFEHVLAFLRIMKIELGMLSRS